MESLKSTLPCHGFVFIVGYIKFSIYIVTHDAAKSMMICFVRNV